jgi:parvulin-like peptidyl-prolyl isomerase
MDALSINTLRIVLVGLSALATVVAVSFGQWVVAGVLGVGVVAHGAMWVWLAQQRTREHDELHRNVEDLLREEA